MSAATCQNVMIGYQRINAVRSRPGGSLSQSGRLNSRSSDHQTIGSDGCCRNSTRVPSHGDEVSVKICLESMPCENRTVRPLS